MALLNYTTNIPAGQTASEIIAVLSQEGATQIGMTFGGRGQPTGLRWKIDTAHGPLDFALPVNAEAVFNILTKQRVLRTKEDVRREQAERTAWRILKEWMEAPSDYRAGYEKSCLVDRETTDNYIAHTLIGDPVMDAVVEELAWLPQSRVHQFIQAGMDGDRGGMRDAPELLRAFFVDAPQPDPDWLDHDAFGPGVRAFQRNSVAVLPGFATGVLIDGFSTLISKSFAQTGRIFDNGVWRLKQNNRHQMEIFWPGGLERHGDGWKLSVRIRFVHAQVRRLLAQTEEWEHDAWGVPVSAAHLGYAVSCFAARTVRHSKALGAHYSNEEQAGFHAVWRYAGYLMGIPETILFTDESHALHIYRIGSLCEPPPTPEAVIMTNALVNSAPLVAGITDTEERKKLVNNVIYPVSRGLVGNALANQLNFPKSRLPFPLLLYRLDQRRQRLRSRLRKEGPKSFSTLLEASAYDEAGLTYRLPDHAHAERSGKW